MLQSIVAALDRELDRLYALRSIVAGLSRTPEGMGQPIASPVIPAERDVTEPVASRGDLPATQRKTRAVAGMPRDKRTQKREATLEPRAFSSVIPTGPVVFNPARLAEEKAKREPSPASAGTASLSEDLDALARSMAAHWGTARV